MVVTVIGVLAIVFGAFTVLSLPINVLQMSGMWPGSEFTRPLFEGPVLGTWMKVSIALMPVIAALWIACGVGLLRLREWARKLTIGVLVVGLVMQAASAVFVMPAMGRALAGASTFPPGSPQAAMMQGMMSVAVIVGGVVGGAIAVTLIVLLTRPHAREAFQP
jgi:hypothetical protein